MPLIPLPFVISFVLCLVLVRMQRQDQEPLGLFQLLVAACAVQAALSGLHWGLGWQSTRLVQPTLAAVLPPLAFVAFAQLRRGEAARFSQLTPHLAPMGVILCLIALWREPIDLVLFVIYLGYGLALLRLARQGPDSLAATRLGDGTIAYKALVAIALLLILTAFVDAAVSLDLVFGTGQQAMVILTVASVLWLAAAGYAATVADASRPRADLTTADFASRSALSSAAQAVPSPTPSSFEDVSEADAEVLRRVDVLMTDQRLYRDSDLTLERLARRAGIPARQISGALNRVRGRNVSQVVNEYRIEDAKRRLLSTCAPVTEVMLEAGFGTKSNFNREFLRVTGMTPSAYRRSGGESPVPSGAREAHTPS